MKIKYLLLSAACWFAGSAAAQSTLGTWINVDDETGVEKTEVKIYEQNGKQYGQIVRILQSPNHLCDKCTDYRKDKPILNMIVIEDMAYKDGVWQGGRALHTRQGKWYDLKYWLKDGDPNTLVLRGSWGPFYRTQYWKRAR